MNSFALKRSVWLQKTLSSCLSIRSRPVPTVVMLWACYVSTLMLCKRRKPQTRQCTQIFLSFFLLFPHIFRVASPGAQGAGWGCKGRAIQRPQGAPHKWRAEMDPCREKPKENSISTQMKACRWILGLGLQLHLPSRLFLGRQFGLWRPETISKRFKLSTSYMRV